MQIRIPVKADTEVRSAFTDVQKGLDEIAELRKEIVEIRRLLTEVIRRFDVPHYQVQGDTVINGDLRVQGDIDVRGDVAMPSAVNGAVKAPEPGTAGTSLAQQTVEVHGALKVTSGLRADQIFCREIYVAGQLLNVP